MRKSTVVALSLAALVVLPSSAGAATKQLSGTIKNTDDDAKVGSITVKVSVKKGVVKRVTSARVRGLRTRCLGEDGVQPGPTITATLKANLKVRKVKVGGKTVYAFQGTNVRGGGTGWAFSGTFTNKKGKKIKNGRVEGGGFQPAPEGTRCSILGAFTAK